MIAALPVHGRRFARAFALALAAVAVTPANVAAQSLFDALFGAPKPSFQPPAHYPSAQRLLPPGSYSSGQPFQLRPGASPRRDVDDDGEARASRSSGRGGLHTVCVRMCDGFYWPVSFSAPKSKLYRDANVCSSSCTSEAKLFHYPTNGGEMKDAVDLTGRVYGRLPTAFKYRKSLVQGCTCKPEPWSEAEVDRHRIYALNEESAKAGAEPAARTAALPVPPPSGPQQSGFVGDATDVEPEAASATRPAETTAAAAEDEARQAPIRKPARSRTLQATSVNIAQRNVAPPSQLRVKVLQAPPATGGFWGQSQPKFAWPGDAPVRVR